MPEGIDKGLLEEYIATANSGKYKSMAEVNAKFPELKDYSPDLLEEYVATANSGKYKTLDEVNLKFPEFSTSAKPAIPSFSTDMSNTNTLPVMKNSPLQANVDKPVKVATPTYIDPTKVLKTKDVVDINAEKAPKTMAQMDEEHNITMQNRKIATLTQRGLDESIEYQNLLVKKQAKELGYTDDKTLNGTTAVQKLANDREEGWKEDYLEPEELAQVRAFDNYQVFKEQGKEKESNEALQKYLKSRTDYRKGIDNDIVNLKGELASAEGDDAVLIKATIAELEAKKLPFYDPKKQMESFLTENETDVAAVSRPTETAQEKLKKYILAQDNLVHNLRNRLGLTDKNNSFQRFTDEWKVLSGDKRQRDDLEFLHNQELKLKNAVQILELNRTPLDKDSAWGVFAKEYVGGLIPQVKGFSGTDNTIAANIGNIVQDADITYAANEKQVQTAKFANNQYQFGSAKWIAQNLAPTLAVMTEMIPAAVLTEGIGSIGYLSRLSRPLKILAERGSLGKAGGAFFKVIQANKYGRGLLKAAASGVNYGIESQAVTTLAPQLKDEMGFSNGLFAGTVGSVAGQLAGKVMETSLKSIATLFGNKAPQAIAAIEKYGSVIAKAKEFSNTVAGETTEEYGEQLMSIYKESSNYKNFIYNLKKHYETTDALEEFATILMMSVGAPAGSTLGRSLFDASKKAYNNLNRKERETASRMAEEIHNEVNLAMDDAANQTIRNENIQDGKPEATAKNIEEQDNAILQKQKELKLPTAPEVVLSDVSKAAMVKMESGEALTIEELKELSNELYQRYNGISATKDQDNRQFTTEQINETLTKLENNITLLENSKNKLEESGETTIVINPKEAVTQKAKPVTSAPNTKFYQGVDFKAQTGLPNGDYTEEQIKAAREAKLKEAGVTPLEIEKIVNAEQEVIPATEAPAAPVSGVSGEVQESGDVENKRDVSQFANENESYRVIVGDEAFNDIVESGVVRTNAGNKNTNKEDSVIDLTGRPTAFPSFSKGSASMSYAGKNPNNYIIVTEDPSIQPSKSGRHGKGKTMFPTDENGNHLKELSGDKVKVYKHIGNGQYELVYDKGKVVEKSLPNIEQTTTNEQQNDKENGTGIQSNIGEGQEPIKTQPNENGGTEKISPSGNVQASEEKVVKPIEAKEAKERVDKFVSETIALPTTDIDFKNLLETNPKKALQQLIDFHTNAMKGQNEVTKKYSQKAIDKFKALQNDIDLLEKETTKPIEAKEEGAKKTVKVTPKEGDTSTTKSARGMIQNMVFKDGEWQIKFGKDFTKVASSVQKEAQDSFNEKNAPVAEVKEQAPVVKEQAAPPVKAEEKPIKEQKEPVKEQAPVIETPVIEVPKLEIPVAETPVTENEPIVEEEEQYEPITVSDTSHEKFTKDNAVDYEEGEKEGDNGRSYPYLASVTVELTDDVSGDSIGTISKLKDEDGEITWNAENNDGDLVAEEYSSKAEAQQALVDNWNKQKLKEFNKEKAKAAKEKIKEAEKAKQKAEKEAAKAAKAAEKAVKKSKPEQIGNGLLDLLGIAPETDVKFSKTTGEPQILTSIEEKEQEIVDQMNEMNLVNEGIDLVTTSTTKEEINVDELNSRLDNPLEKINWSDYEGVPFTFTISDQLRTGDAVNPNTGQAITDLKGGIGFNGTKGNENNAWANTTKEEAESMLQRAKDVYANNKPLFDKLWKEGKLPDGHIPMAVVKMAETSILSNEAVFRVGIQNIETLPKANRKKAVSELAKSMQAKIDTETASLKRGVDKNGKPYTENTTKLKKKAVNQYQKILDSINKNKYNDIVDILKDKDSFSLPEKALIANEVFYGNPNPIGGKEIDISRSRPSTPVSKALLGDANPALINLGKITDLITEPSMKNVPNMHIVSIVGVDIRATEVNEISHPNYPYGVKGVSIGIVKNPIHMKDAFGEAYGSALGQVIKNEAAKASISIKAALTQGIPVQSGLPNRVFKSAIARGELDAVDKLAGFLRQAFPSTTFFTSNEAWDAAMEDPSVKKKLKDGDVVYAFTTNGNVFINPTLKTTKAALHETGHIWMSFVKENNPALYAKGLKLVTNTREHQKAIKEYGDTELAREEALMELMSSKGDTIVRASDRAKFKEWLLSVYKYVADNFTSLLGLNPKQIENLTLDKFLEGMLADILSGKELTTKKVKGGVKFSLESQNSKIRDYIEKQREAGESDADIRAGVEMVADKLGLTKEDINNLMSENESPTATTEQAEFVPNAKDIESFKKILEGTTSDAIRINNATKEAKSNPDFNPKILEIMSNFKELKKQLIDSVELTEDCSW